MCSRGRRPLKVTLISPSLVIFHRSSAAGWRGEKGMSNSQAHRLLSQWVPIAPLFIHINTVTPASRSNECSSSGNMEQIYASDALLLDGTESPCSWSFQQACRHSDSSSFSKYSSSCLSFYSVYIYIYVHTTETSMYIYNNKLWKTWLALASCSMHTGIVLFRPLSHFKNGSNRKIYLFIVENS